MVHMSTAAVLNPARGMKPFSARFGTVEQTVLLMRDDDKHNQLVETICEFLDLGIEHVTSADDLAPMLRGVQPIAVIAELEGRHQDGFHAMKIAAGHNPDLPVLLLTDGDPALLGAVDAMKEICGLTRVAAVTGAGDIAAMVDFLCHAARRSGMSRMMRI